MSEPCELLVANGEPNAHCEGPSCSFWRLVDHVDGASGEGCAIRHYQLLGDDDVATWLLSVKTRLDAVADHRNAHDHDSESAVC